MRFSAFLRLAAVASFATSPVLSAQSLDGSMASINRMYRQALAEKFSFFETGAGVRKAVAAGWLVRLPRPDRDFEVADVAYPFVRPATRTFVERLAEQYQEGCGEPLVVTSAVRPATRQPANATERSVHPAGMAVDLRKPRNSACLRWLREALLGLERRRLIEATEEHSPAHFHVAVFSTPYSKYVASRASASNVLATYVVRRGNTLWDIARDHDVTVKAIVEANDLDGETIVPGQVLTIPDGR